jgi:ferredoxin
LTAGSNSAARPHIHSDECVNCGAGELAGPVEAISFEADMPAQRKNYSQVNAEFFTALRRMTVQH